MIPRARLCDSRLRSACMVLRCSIAAPAHATTYKWVDDKGVVHYTDKIPPEAVDKASVELNKQGVQVKKTDKAITPEQRRAVSRRNDAQQATKTRMKSSGETARCCVTYTTEGEIDLAKIGAFGHDRQRRSIGAGLHATSSTNARPRLPQESRTQGNNRGSPQASTAKLASINDELAKPGRHPRRQAKAKSSRLSRDTTRTSNAGANFGRSATEAPRPRMAPAGKGGTVPTSAKQVAGRDRKTGSGRPRAGRPLHLASPYGEARSAAPGLR